MMLHFLPDFVAPERLVEHEEHRPIPIYAVAPEPRGLVPASGVLRHAHGASAEKGKALAEYLTDEITGILRKEFPEIAAQVNAPGSVAR